MEKLFTLIIILLILGCAPKVSKNIVNPSTTSLSSDEEVRIIELDASPPPSATYIGRIKVGDNGLTGANPKLCTYEKMLEVCRKEAIESGANILQLVKVKNPDFLTKCYRIEAKLYSDKKSKLADSLLVTEPLSIEENFFLSRIQGIRKGAYTFYNAEGYQVIKYDSNKEFNQKNIKSLKKKFKVKKDDSGKKSEWINVDNLYFETSEMTENLRIAKSTFIYLNSENTLSAIELSTSLEKVDSLERKWVQLIYNNKIPADKFSPSKIDSIYFVNRFITLGPACQWQEVRNIQCSYSGQMDWSIFSKEARAKKYLDQRIKTGREKSRTELVEQKKIPVIFEGTRTTAEKHLLKIKSSISWAVGSNQLIVYYVLVKIENDYVVAVLSHYDNDQNGSTLSPLLAEVMSLE